LVTVGPLGALIAAGAAAAGMAAGKIFQCADCSAAAATLRAHLQGADAVLVKASRGEKLERVIEDLTKGVSSA
jgi:UDP-N-acetylmuramyl pentapeptide synthase